MSACVFCVCVCINKHELFSPPDTTQLCRNPTNLRPKTSPHSVAGAGAKSSERGDGGGRGTKSTVGRGLGWTGVGGESRERGAGKGRGGRGGSIVGGTISEALCRMQDGAQAALEREGGGREGEGVRSWTGEGGGARLRWEGVERATVINTPSLASGE